MKARWISILLCMSMLFSNVPVTVFADGETETASVTETQVPAENESETKAPAESESVSETKAPAESESVSETKAPAESESESETKAPAESESVSETKTPTESESESETQVPAESESESESSAGEGSNQIDETGNTGAQDADAAKVAAVQALADALPDVVTLENKEATGNQLNAFIQAYGNLDAALQAQVDLTKYDKTIAAMYELEGMAGAQNPQTIASSNLRVWDEVCQEEVTGLTFKAVNASNVEQTITNGDDLLTKGFKEDRTYQCTLASNNTGKNYEIFGNFFVYDGWAKLVVYRQYDLTVKVVDSLGTNRTNTAVTLNLPLNETRTGTTDASGEVTFTKIRGLYTTVNASVSYTKADGTTGTVTASNISMRDGDRTITLTIPCEKLVTVKVTGNYSTSVIENDVTNAVVTVKNSNNESVTLTRNSDGTYTGLVKRTSLFLPETFTISVTANGYDDATKTEVSSGTAAIDTTIGLNMKALQVNGITNNQQMSTGTKYNVSIPSECIPEDWALAYNAEMTAFDITESNGTWIIIPKKTGTYTLELGLGGVVNSEPVMIVNTYSVTVSKGTIAYPAAPSLSSVDTDITTETFRLPSDLMLAQKLTITAVDTANNTVIKEQEYTNLTAGGTVSMQLKDSVVQGSITYTYTYSAGTNEVQYTGDIPKNSKNYYQSLSDLTIGNTTLEYNGQHQYPTVNSSGKYNIQTGYYFFNSDSYFVPTETILPNANNSYTFEIMGSPVTENVEKYVMKVTGNESEFYKGESVVEYTIVKRPITLTVKDQDIVYGSSIASGADAVTVSGSGLASGHTLSLTAAASTTKPTQNGTITVSDVKIMNDSEDVTKHYTVTEENNPGKLTISKIPMSRITVEVPETVTYNGEKQTPVVVKLDGNVLTAGTDYTVTYEDNKNAGTATVTVSNSSWETETVTKTFEILKRPLTASIQEADEVYDGTKAAENATIVLSGICLSDDVKVNTEKVKISYQDANAGTNKAVTAEEVELTGDAAGNYKLVNTEGTEITSLTGTGTISKRPVTVKADSLKKTYGQADPELTWQPDERVVEGENLTGINIERNEGEDAGDYVITVSQDAEANSNYAITFVSGKFTIEKKELTVIVSDLDKQYDGLNTATFTAELNGIERNDPVTLDSSAVVAEFETVDVKEGINIILTGEFTIDADSQKNYTVIQPTGITANIYNTYEAEEYTVTPTDWTNDVVKISAAEGYLISEGNKDDSNWTKELTYAAETAKEGQEVTFYLRNESTKAISLPETEVYYIDTTVPTGTIAISELEGWNKLLDVVTFERFFHEIQTVTIDSDDTLSGVKRVEYYESDTALSLEELEGITDWKTYTESFQVEIEDAKKFIYFAKITDNAGNVTYLSTDGAVYDISAPEIDGIINSGIYHTTQRVTVTDANLSALTLNGEDITSPFALEGNKDIIYTIYAKDEAGNSTTVSVIMRPIAVLDDSIEELDESNVTSDQKDTIQDVLDQAEELLKDENLTEDEKNALEEIKNNAENLKDTVEKAQEDISKEEISKTDDLDASNVKLEDKADVQAAKDALKQALQDNAGNYTEKEKAEIQSKIDRLEQAEEAVEKTEHVIGLITALPEASNPDMTEEEEKAILGAQEAFQALSEYERSLVSEKDQEKLETLTAGLTDYEIIKGNKEKWIKEQDGSLQFVANGAYRKFVALWIDGELLDENNYTVEAGMTVVNLKATYLETLLEGEHTISIRYTDGKADGTFTVLAAKETETEAETSAETDKTQTSEIQTEAEAAATGDDTNMMLWLSVMLVSALCVLWLAGSKRRTRER